MQVPDIFYSFLQLFTYICAVSMLKTRAISINLQSCTTSNIQVFDVSQMSVKNIIDCALSYLESESSNVMVIQQRNDGAVWCGLSLEIPIPSTCSEHISDVLVYQTTDRPLVCPVTCHTHLDLDNITYCIHRTDKKSSYIEAAEQCAQYGGDVAQAETLQDLEILWKAKPIDYCIWLGGNDHQVQSEYRWNRGDLVSSDLWHDGEPSYDHEHCISLNDELGVFKLRDMGCGQWCFALCAIKCEE